MLTLDFISIHLNHLFNAAACQNGRKFIATGLVKLDQLLDPAITTSSPAALRGWNSAFVNCRNFQIFAWMFNC